MNSGGVHDGSVRLMLPDQIVVRSAEFAAAPSHRAPHRWRVAYVIATL
jgi:hypothetical protein